MALTPNYNYTFSTVTYNNNIVIGEQPKTMQGTVDVSNFTAADYVMGTLLANTATAGHYTIYDSTVSSPAKQTFAGVFFDDTATTSQIETGFVNIAIKDGMMTMWAYDSLVGTESGTTDIDALIAGGLAKKVYQNGAYYVQFSGIGYGINPMA